MFQMRNGSNFCECLQLCLFDPGSTFFGMADQVRSVDRSSRRVEAPQVSPSPVPQPPMDGGAIRNEEKRTEREAEPIGGRNLWNGDGAARLLQFGGSRVATNRLFVQSVNTNSPFTCEVSLFTNIPGRNNIPKHACPFQFVLIIYVRNHICIVHSKHSFFCFFFSRLFIPTTIVVHKLYYGIVKCVHSLLSPFARSPAKPSKSPKSQDKTMGRWGFTSERYGFLP